MKNLLISFVALISVAGIAQTAPGFTISNTSGSNSITCANPAINYLATGAPNLSYVWASSTTTLSGSSVTINSPGTYTVTANDSLNVSSQVIAVGINTIAPISALNPTIATITCNLNSAVTFTGSSNVPNCTHYFSAPQGATANYYNVTSLYTPFAPGTYTYILEDNSNGCKTIKTFAINSNTSHPTFNLFSPQSFTLGCGSKSVAVVSIVNASTTNSLQIPTGGPVSYSIVSQFASSVSATGTLSGISNYTLANSGSWTVVVRDNVNYCDSRIPFTVLQNTNTPNIQVSVPQQVLDCNTSSITLKASSSAPNVSYNWTFPGTPGNNPFDTLVVKTVTSSPTASIVANYSISISDNSSTCKTFSVIPIYQNIYKPKTQISSGGNSTITCQTPTIMLTNVSTTGIPPSTGFSITAPVIGLLWEGPAPLLPASLSTTYIANISGIYTLTAKDLNNGCVASNTFQIYGDCNLVGIEKSISLSNSFKIYPNPNNGEFTINNTTANQNLKVHLYNALGELIKSEIINSEVIKINLQHENKGIYVLQIIENESVILSKKILIQ